MIIRDFKVTDLDSVLKIEFDSFKEPYPVDLIMKLYDAGAGFLVAEISNVVVGYIIFWVKDKIGHIIVIAVDGAFRSIGIGRMLLLHAIHIFSLNQIYDIKLEVKKSNRRAQEFYKRNGFKIIGVEEGYYSDGEAAVIMLYSHHNT